jgi:hypothetical protein
MIEWGWIELLIFWLFVFLLIGLAFGLGFELSETLVLNMFR